jgi:hypothetical protein
MTLKNKPSPGFDPLSPGGAPDDDASPPVGANTPSDGGECGLLPSIGNIGLDLDLDGLLSKAVQIGSLGGDCQPCGDDSGGLDVNVDANAGVDLNGLAIAPLGECLPDLPVLSGLLGGSGYTGDHDDGAGGTADCGTTTSGGTTGDSGDSQSGVNIDVGLGDGGGTGGDALSVLLNGTPLLDGFSGSDGLLEGTILSAGAGAAESGAGVPVDVDLLPSIDCVLDGLVGSIDLLHL